MHYFRGPRRMDMNAAGCVLSALGCLLGTASFVLAQQSQKTAQATQPDQVEEIYIVRSVRESRVAPTEFCAKAKTGFESTADDQYTFRSTAVSTDDGRMTDTSVKTIGSGHGCLGPNADPAILNFYLELDLGRMALKGIGNCRRTKSDFPERGIQVWHCVLDLSDPARLYVGGYLTSNTIASLKLAAPGQRGETASVGMESDPPGYTQPSIATIRLWKKRAGR
jgi:hypothetical protein